MRRGVTMWDPERTYLDVSVGLAADVTLLPGVILEGSTTVGVGAVLGPSVHLVDCEVASGATISHTVASNAVIGEQCSVGPYVVLEKGTRLGAGRAARAVLRTGRRRDELSAGAVFGPRLPPRA